MKGLDHRAYDGLSLFASLIKLAARRRSQRGNRDNTSFPVIPATYPG
jgi:hypothetical protein